MQNVANDLLICSLQHIRCLPLDLLWGLHREGLLPLQDLLTQDVTNALVDTLANCKETDQEAIQGDP